MFDFGQANEGQKLAISTTEGPVLIIAGPGTGKTYTLVQRALFLIQKCNIGPEQIMMATFTEKAAKEIITRLTNELAERNITVNVNEMYIGTFHSICLRLLKENLEYTRLKKNYRLLDDFEQSYFVFQNITGFRDIPGTEKIFSMGAWKMSQEICSYVNNLQEELVREADLQGDSDAEVQTMGAILKHYKKLLADNNMLDFASIQTEAYHLLHNNPQLLQEIQDKLVYLMVDEYQDTNFIQEKLVFLLAGTRQNICVVGDDDQGLYRFRGATIRNILEFPAKFPAGACRIIPLTINYRSNSSIVDFYNRWMADTEGADFKFAWDKYRYAKRIQAYQSTDIKSPTVIKISGASDEDEWHEKIIQFIEAAKASGKISNLNQIAFLFSSVKAKPATRLAKFLEVNHINVYSPRSNMFFERKEIMLVLGCLLLLFPHYVRGLEKDDYTYLQAKHREYYIRCIKLATQHLKGNKYFLQWLQQRGRQHVNLAGTTDYNYSGLLYQMFEYEPFREILATDMSAGVADIRPLRNLALLSRLIGRYEYLHRIDILHGKYLKSDTEKLFNLYLRLLLDGRIDEYEDEAEYAPSGCVSFLTIHQAKGMEFPIVITDSLGSLPRKRQNNLMLAIEERYFQRPGYEPLESIKFFDFWRLYYTAFSRAQDLLVLTCAENSRTPSKYFRDVYKGLPDIGHEGFSWEDFSFHKVKTVNLKETFSFTSHVTVYETCARQYQFYKELEFMPVRAGAMIFGRLVHETIEDVHRAVLRHEESTVTKDNIIRWFGMNYDTLSRTEHQYLAEPQKQAALGQVLRYVDRQQDKWDMIQQAEVDVSLVKPDYILEGKIDLIRGENGTVEIVDFKSEKKPDMEKDRAHLEQYRRQLHIYAHLVEERTGQKVSRMHLYYTGEEDGVPTITYPYSRTAVAGTIAAVDDTVHRIMKHDYGGCAHNDKICRNCDFRYYCQRG